MCAVKKVSVAVMFYTCILEMLGSNLGQDIMTEVFHGYPQFFQANAGIFARSILILLDLRFTRG
jgi:hypothetical protein